jgi:hypothetical protein
MKPLEYQPSWDKEGTDGNFLAGPVSIAVLGSGSFIKLWSFIGSGTLLVYRAFARPWFS